MSEVPTLPKTTRDLLAAVGVKKRHPGLQLDKLSAVGNMESQKQALEKVTATHRDNQLLQKLRDRRCDTLDQLLAQRLTMTTGGPLTLHLSRSGALENAGIALHPLYGFAYLPGSGIKGLTRAYAETIWAPAQPDPEKAWRQIEGAFGWSRGSERHKGNWRPQTVEPQAGASTGRIVFHDAWPLCWPKLIIDIANNHHPAYYDGQDDPGDWEDPTPIYFLALGAGEQFDFALSDRKRENDRLLSLACDWLKSALTIEGAGAKTAAGYGRFKPKEGKRASIPQTLCSATYDLRLASPAFLAGANQQQEDCDLRPATLRGLLRWWWRTMHAAHLDRATLKKLETAVWGDAESGSPVRIAVEREGDEKPTKYDHKDDKKKFLPESNFKRQHDLQAPPDKKTTQGLFYASYGMDDAGKKRWYRPAGTRWSIRLDVRRGRLPVNTPHMQPLKIEPADLLAQAEVALWLLCRFGGVGSKGRKGFGSFADIEVEGIANAQDCQDRARDFRRHTCQLSDHQGKTGSPALEQMNTCEILTPWSDPWTVLDQLGYAVQGFAQQYAHDERKKALGLPRKIHGPRSLPIVHQKQNPRNHKQPKTLSAGGIKRHTAPIHYHLATTDEGKLLVRATAFPAHRLPNYRKSKEMLDKLVAFLKEDLKKRVEQNPNIGQNQGGNSPAKPAKPLPQARDRVQAELLDEKTKKGRWKAKLLDGELQGPIQDHENVPDDAKPGQRVELTVVSVSEREVQFRWKPLPTPKKTSGQNNEQRRGRRR